jgi:quinol monooxygenase YgiN
MHMLRIEHGVADYDAWKQVFDSGPLGRAEAGVRRYHLYRAADDPNHVIIDLAFDDAGPAEAFLGKLQEMWERVDVMQDPRARIAELVESAPPTP